MEEKKVEVQEKAEEFQRACKHAQDELKRVLDSNHELEVLLVREKEDAAQNDCRRDQAMHAMHAMQRAKDEQHGLWQQKDARWREEMNEMQATLKERVRGEKEARDLANELKVRLERASEIEKQVEQSIENVAHSQAQLLQQRERSNMVEEDWRAAAHTLQENLYRTQAEAAAAEIEMAKGMAEVSSSCKPEQACVAHVMTAGP